LLLFVINGSIADYIIVLCKTNSIGNSKFITVIVKRNQEGVITIWSQKMMGLRMSSISKIRFDHVRIPKDHWIRGDSERPEHLKSYLIERRIKTSAQALGIAQGAFDSALKHAKNRDNEKSIL
jgi:alkylation response protein AidB-like acyl-CoA dehydrogenase